MEAVRSAWRAARREPVAAAASALTGACLAAAYIHLRGHLAPDRDYLTQEDFDRLKNKTGGGYPGAYHPGLRGADASKGGASDRSVTYKNECIFPGGVHEGGVPGFEPPRKKSILHGVFPVASAEERGRDNDRDHDWERNRDRDRDRDDNEDRYDSILAKARDKVGSALEKGKETAKSVVGKTEEVVKSPIEKIKDHVAGFGLHSSNQDRQLEVHHYCSRINKDLSQCALYDSDRPWARLIGVEYVLSERVFKLLSESEKKLWHSHMHDVRGGLMIMPDLEPAEEKHIMRHLAKTYGKAWITWQRDRNEDFPLGGPSLLMSFTENKDIDRGKLEARDKRYGRTTGDDISDRADIEGPEGGVDSDADSWQSGTGCGVGIYEIDIIPVPVAVPVPIPVPAADAEEDDDQYVVKDQNKDDRESSGTQSQNNLVNR